MKALLEQEAVFDNTAGPTPGCVPAIINVGGLGGTTFSSVIPKDETEAKVINTDARLLVLAFNSI